MDLAKTFHFDHLPPEKRSKRIGFIKVNLYAAFGGFLWGSTYTPFGQYGAMITGFGYITFVLLGLLFLRLKGSYRAFRILGLAVLLLNPIASQLSLGGFVQGSAVILASSLAPICALMVYNQKASRLYFYAFCVVVIGTGAAEHFLIEPPDNPIPKNISLLFFVSNSITIPAIFYFVLEYIFGQQQKFKKVIEDKNHELVEKQNEITAFNEELQQQKEELSATLDVLKEKNDIINRSNEKIRAGITYAGNIQTAMLPSEARVSQYFGGSFFALSKPRDIVSGDLYWCEEVEDTIYMAVADCTGHGVPGALMSMMAISELNNIVFQEKIFSPEEILSALHDHVYRVLRQDNRNNNDGMDIALLAYNRAKGTMEFAGAMNPVYYVQNDEIKVIKGNKYPIGGYHYSKKRVYTKHQIDIAKPTVFYMTSDGFQDQFGGRRNRKFGASRLRKFLLAGHDKGFKTQKKELDTAFKDWMNEGKERQIDDVMVVGFQVR